VENVTSVDSVEEFVVCPVCYEDSNLLHPLTFKGENGGPSDCIWGHQFNCVDGKLIRV